MTRLENGANKKLKIPGGFRAHKLMIRSPLDKQVVGKILWFPVCVTLNIALQVYKLFYLRAVAYKRDDY